MNKQTKMLLGVGAVALVGYFVWKQGQKPKGFANAVGGKESTTCRSVGQVCGVNSRCVRSTSGALVCVTAN